MTTYRSKYEKRVAKNSSKKIKYEDVESELQYTVCKKYKPDFILPNGILVETKGYFPPQDRSKMKHVKRCNPDKDIRLLFMNPHQKISKKSKTTYAMWAEKNGFPWASGEKIPYSWLQEKK